MLFFRWGTFASSPLLTFFCSVFGLVSSPATLPTPTHELLQAISTCVTLSWMFLFPGRLNYWSLVPGQMLSPLGVAERLRQLCNKSRNYCHDYYVLIIHVPKETTHWCFTSATHWVSALLSLERNWTHVCWPFIQNCIKQEHSLSEAVWRKPPGFLCAAQSFPGVLLLWPLLLVLCDARRDSDGR